VNDLARTVEIHPAAEIVAADSDQGDPKIGISQRALFHGETPNRSMAATYGCLLIQTSS
jgi:hypothetical protein